MSCKHGYNPINEFDFCVKCAEEDYKKLMSKVTKDDPVNHPTHYQMGDGVEVIQLTEKMGFLEGNVVKYVCRAGKKGEKLQDLKKARWYLERLIKNEEKKGTKNNE